MYTCARDASHVHINVHVRARRAARPRVPVFLAPSCRRSTRAADTAGCGSRARASSSRARAAAVGQVVYMHKGTARHRGDGGGTARGRPRRHAPPACRRRARAADTAGRGACVCARVGAPSSSSCGRSINGVCARVGAPSSTTTRTRTRVRRVRVRVLACAGDAAHRVLRNGCNGRVTDAQADVGSESASSVAVCRVPCVSFLFFSDAFSRNLGGGHLCTWGIPSDRSPARIALGKDVTTFF